MAMRSAAAALAILVLLSDCAERIAESRLRGTLVDAGLSRGDAACMAERMVDRLTIAQIRKLEVLQMPLRTLPDYVFAVRQLGDAKLLGVTASSAALCESGLAPESR